MKKLGFIGTVRTSVLKDDLGQQSVQMTSFLLRLPLMQKGRSHLVSCKRTTVLYTPLRKSKQARVVAR